MKRNISLFVLCLVIIGLSSCSGKYVRGNSFGLMYEEKPVTVLLFPPINQTEVPGVEHDLWEAFYMAMCEKGYYAFSTALCYELFSKDSLYYNADSLYEGDLSRLHAELEVDAALFVKVKSFRLDKTGANIDFECRLRSAKSGRILYSYDKEVRAFAATFSGGRAFAFGVPMEFFLQQLDAAMSDKLIAVHNCAVQVLVDMPVGKYSKKRYGKDRNVIVSSPKHEVELRL